jgi:hypothetical protein
VHMGGPGWDRVELVVAAAPMYIQVQAVAGGNGFLNPVRLCTGQPQIGQAACMHIKSLRT